MRQPDELLERLSDGVLRECLIPYDDTFASGIRADNKLDLELLRHNPDLYHNIVAASGAFLRDLFGKEMPSLIVPVPNGANRFGRDLAGSLGVSATLLDKDPFTKQISILPDATEIVRSEGQKVLIVEDLINHGTSSRKVQQALGDLVHVDSVFAIWDRGDPAQRVSMELSVHSLVYEHIPPILPTDSPYRQHLQRDDRPSWTAFFANEY